MAYFAKISFTNTCAIVLSLLGFSPAVLGADSPDLKKVVPEISVVGRGATAENPVGMDGDVVIKVSNLYQWLQQEKEKRDLSGLVVYLNGIAVKNTPIRDLGDDQIAIRLQRTGDTKATWSQLLGRPTQRTRDLKIAIGTATGQRLSSHDMYIQFISPGWLALS